MEKSEIRVFIVDDDATLSKAFGEVVKKAGYTPVLCSNPTDALSQFKIQGGHFFLIDCLLPKMTGVELAQKLRQEGATDTPIVLMSGVFKDKGFIKDATKKTGAKNFLTKPFNLTELTQELDALFKNVVDEQISPLESFLIKSFSPGEKIKNVNQLEQIDSLDIPLIAFNLMHPAISGILKLQHSTHPANIVFFEGKIIQVEMKNPESVFGNLLIENGFISTDQLDEALKISSEKKIGERLVDLNYLSPHAIDLTNAEQMAIRLSKLINLETYSVSFEPKSTAGSSTFLDTESVTPFLIDWLNSKMNLQWLKQRYLKWGDSPCVKAATAGRLQRLWSFPLLKTRPALIADFEGGKSLDQVLAKNQYPEEIIYQVFHLLLMVEHIKLKKEIRRMDDSGAQLARLKKIWLDMQNQDYFAILGVSRNTKPADIKRTYHELAKIFHPDKVSTSSSPELKDVAQKVFGQMTKAYEILSNDAKKEAHLKEIEMGRAEKVLQSEALLEEGKALLSSGQASRALDKLREAQKLKTPSSELLVLLAWALLATSEQAKNLSTKTEAEDILNKIPPEDRHNASYYFVKGYFQKLSGENAAAKKNVLHALSLKPKFIEAERLLRFIDTQKAPKGGDLLHGDLKDVVGSLFKKS